MQTIRSVALTLITVGAAPVLGQVDPLKDLGDPIATLDEPFKRIASRDLAETVLLPAIASIESPPSGARTPELSVLLTTDLPAWDDAMAWLNSQPQQDAIGALKSVSESDSRFVFAMPYAYSALSDEIRATGLGVTLVDGRLLAGATFPYLAKLDLLQSLVFVDAERLASEGDGVSALDMLRRNIWLGRRLADRSFHEEMLWGLRTMNRTLEAARDLLYRYPDAFREQALIGAISALGENRLLITRMAPPEGDRLAALQTVRESFQRFAGPHSTRFGTIMAAAESGNRPLLRFGRADWWSEVGDSHADYYETIDSINAVFDDWRLRWSGVMLMSRDGGSRKSDPLFEQPTHYEMLDPAKFALVRSIVPDLETIISQQWELAVNIAGTRTAFAVMGYRARNGGWPRPLFAVRPRYVRTLDLDPYDENGLEPLRYFVPIRDQPRREREAPTPHKITIMLEAPSADLTSIRQLLKGIDQQAAALFQAAPENQRQTVFRNFEQMLSAMSRSDNTALADANSPAALLIKGVALTLAVKMGQEIPENRIPPIRSRAAELLDEDDDFQDIITKFQAGQRFNETTMSRLFVVIVRATTRATAEYLGIPEELSVDNADVVVVELDDTQFVLYSIGEDKQMGWARFVGPGGEDILLWPPFISLARERLLSRLEQ